METNIVVDILPPIPYLAKFWFLVKFWFLSYGPKWCQPIKLQDSLKCNISRKKWIMKCIFCMQININIFCKLMLLFWVCATRTRHAQSTQNKKFTYLCNISRKTQGEGLAGEGEVDFFCLKINTKVFYKLIVSLWVCVARHA